jgi:hypothetical protein
VEESNGYNIEIKNVYGESEMDGCGINMGNGYSRGEMNGWR